MYEYKQKEISNFRSVLAAILLIISVFIAFPQSFSLGVKLGIAIPALIGSFLILFLIVITPESEERYFNFYVFLSLFMTEGSLLFLIYVLDPKEVTSMLIIKIAVVVIIEGLLCFTPTRIINEKTNKAFSNEMNKLFAKSRIPEIYGGSRVFYEIDFGQPSDEKLAELYNILQAEQSLISESDNYYKNLKILIDKATDVLKEIENYKEVKQEDREINNKINDEVMSFFK